MHAFTDAAGREWKIKLDFATAEAIEDACKIDMTVQADLLKLLNDRRTFLAAVAILIRDQLAAAGLAVEDLKAAFDAEVWQRAADALEEEIVFFTRNGRMNRELIPALRKRQEEMTLSMIRRIESGRMDATILAAASASGPTVSPESSASIPPA